MSYNSSIFSVLLCTSILAKAIAPSSSIELKENSNCSRTVLSQSAAATLKTPSGPILQSWRASETRGKSRIGVRSSIERYVLLMSRRYRDQCC